jgi:hypothetical protein
MTLSATGCLLSQIAVDDVSDVVDGQVSADFRRSDVAFAGCLRPDQSIGIVDDAVENRVGERRDSNHLVPAVDRNLAGDDD